jgi:hypothetical protein
MPDWVTTATTIYCDAIEDEVTLIADKDVTMKCTGYNRYFNPDNNTVRSLQRRGKRLNKQLKCEGLDCHRVTQYRDKLLSEKV